MKSSMKAGLLAAAATVLCVSSVDAKPHALTFPAGVIPPPLSMKGSAYFAAHPDAFAKLVASLPRSDQRLAPRSLPGASPWTAMTGAPAGLCSPHLTHNGNVLAQICNSKFWYKLTPSSTGSYGGGHWSAIASLPVINAVQYAPLYYASQVLPDGRLEIQGGEYNGTNTEEWVADGAIYSQSANTWTAVNPPPGITDAQKVLGDSQSVQLANGRMMLGVCCEFPAQNYLFNPTTLTWSATGAPNDYQDEQGYELLPSGKVLTINVWSPPLTQLYTTSGGTWANSTATPAILPDVTNSREIGPAVVRGNGTLVAFGGDTENTAAVPTAIRNNANASWTAGPNLPQTCGSGGTSYCNLGDAPAALEPNGRILFAANAGYFASPAHFFEMKLSDNSIVATTDHPEAPSLPAGTYNFLVLPTGQIMATDFNHAYLYTPTLAAQASWAPTITEAPSSVTRGTTYTIDGTQLNGVSAGAYYGDDWQSFSNFPLVKVVNNASGHVKYANTTAVSSYTIARGASTSFKFTLPSSAQTGASKLYVVANGIKSAAKSITVN